MAKGDFEENKEEVNGIPNSLIVQQLVGAPQKARYDSQPVVTVPIQVDEGHSQIMGGSHYATFRNGVETARFKPSDDQMFIGYTQQGLPFIVAVDGMPATDTNLVKEFVNQHILSFMNEVALKLSQSSPSKTRSIISNFIRSIFLAREKLGQGPKLETCFTLSFGIVYERNSKLYTSGSGLGDIAMALLDSRNQSIKQLTYDTKILHDGNKDALDDATYQEFAKNPDKVIERNSLFCDVPVDENDEIVAYTSLYRPCAAIKESMACAPLVIPEEKKPKGVFNQYKFNSDVYDKKSKDSFFVQMTKANLDQFTKACELMKKYEKDEVGGGDDFMIGAFIVPNQELRDKLINVIVPNQVLRDKFTLLALFKLYLEEQIPRVKSDKKREKMEEVFNAISDFSKSIEDLRNKIKEIGEVAKIRAEGAASIVWSLFADPDSYIAFKKLFDDEGNLKNQGPVKVAQQVPGLK